MAKKLIDPRRLRAINSLFYAAKNYMAGVATRSHRVFGPGTYLVPSALVDEVDARLTQFQVDIASAAELVAQEWPESVERSRVSLGKLFHAGDYLTAEQVRRRFSLDWTYPSFESANLEEISPALARREQQKHHDRLSSAFDEIVLDLRASALKVMRELADRLAPGADGKPKSLFGTALDDLKSYVALLPKRNIGGDDELDAVIAHTAAYVEGVDVATLRNAPAVRRQLQQLAEQAASQLEGLVVTTRRAISFDGPSV